LERFFPQDGQFMVSPSLAGCDRARILETDISRQEEKNKSTDLMT
jgi:hypothetical protein